MFVEIDRLELGRGFSKQRMRRIFFNENVDFFRISRRSELEIGLSESRCYIPIGKRRRVIHPRFIAADLLRKIKHYLVRQWPFPFFNPNVPVESFLLET